MGRNTIDLDQINARLRDKSKVSASDPYGEVPDIIPRGERGEYGPPNNTTFFASIVGVFLLIGAGIFFMPDGISWSSVTNLNWMYHSDSATAFLPSSVDEQCKLNEWVKDTHNNDQMHCYLTTSVSRLCDSVERQGLVALIMRYQNESDNYDGNMALSIIDMQANTPLSDKMQLGVEAAKADHSSNSDEGSKHEQNAEAIASKMLAGTHAVMARQKYMNWGDGSFEGNLQTLGTKGLIALKDFPYYRPKWVTAALQDIKVTTETCKR